MQSTDAFIELVNRRREDEIPLDVGGLLIAARARPDADADEVVAAGRAALDRLAETCGGTTLADLRTHLFDARGFAGNHGHYDDPRNSYLDVVLERGLGIPITLSIVVLEVGRRLGLDLHGVGMPGHFLVGVGDGVYLDAFDHGRLLDQQACRRRFAELVGPGAPWSAALLDPVGPRAILTRVLANLRALFESVQDWHNLDWTLELRLAIPGVPDAERELRSAVLSALGQFDGAAAELERLARTGRHPSVVGSEHEPDELLARAARLRARLN